MVRNMNNQHLYWTSICQHPWLPLLPDRLTVLSLFNAVAWAPIVLFAHLQHLYWWLMMFIYFQFACILHTFAIPLSLLALWWTQVFCIFSDVYLKYLSLQIGCADWIKVKVLGERILRIQKKPFHNRLPADFCFNSSFWNILSRYLSSLALERVTAIAKMAMCKAAFAIVLRPSLKSWSFSKCETIDLFVLLLSRNWLSLWKATIISWPTIKHPDSVPGAKYGAAFVRV